MKFLRHLMVVSVVVALVVSVGFLWSHSGAASLVADGGGDRRANSGISLSNIDDLVQTVVILGLILGGVVAIDQARRRRRGARLGAIKRATTASSPHP